MLKKALQSGNRENFFIKYLFIKIKNNIFCQRWQNGGKIKNGENLERN